MAIAKRAPGLQATTRYLKSGFIDLRDVGRGRRGLNLPAQREGADEDGDGDHEDGDMTEHGTRTASNGDGGEGGDVPGGDLHSLLSEGLWEFQNLHVVQDTTFPGTGKTSNGTEAHESTLKFRVGCSGRTLRATLDRAVRGGGGGLNRSES
jgi:hypothetical protein